MMSSHHIIFEMTEITWDQAKPVLSNDMRWLLLMISSFAMNNSGDSWLKDDPEFVSN